MILFVVAVALGGAAIGLFISAARDTATWEDDRRQVAMMRGWERRHQGGPFDQKARPMPQVSSVYARPAKENPAPLPSRPGQTRRLWGGLVAACSLLALAAAFAAS
ncbi:hypothetical protein [Yimella sp. cx-51]|uniref:hypothetical protein n=1 Tax=Yimella sp. cx-51 TaxID=2770551 RepID=UPI00165EB6BC|nr:hypothetical protein [Yimella sp. cx-51]MBC9958276.1 hypothetical protein [Yimella sp. cx-51]QTH38698.1 hypothetical protein J5M86_03375 [Yimella sp. cx-51]